MKRSLIILSVTILTTICTMFFLAGCEEEREGFGYETNGILEGTVWVSGNAYLSFSKNAVTLTHYLDYGTNGLHPGTYYSYKKDDIIYIADPGHKIYSGEYVGYWNTTSLYFLRLNRSMLKYREAFYDILGVTSAYFFPPAGTLFINGQYRYLNGFGAEETEGGLMITEYIGNLKNLVIPSGIGGVPVVAIGNGNESPFEANDSLLQLSTVIIPDSVTTIKPGAFRSNDLFGYSKQPNTYLKGGITIGANVTIMGKNAGAGWDQGWGALDTAKIGDSNFVAYEVEHTDYWLDMGFVKFYNENGRKAGTYKWSSSYDSYNIRYTFTWSYTPAITIDR